MVQFTLRRWRVGVNAGRVILGAAAIGQPLGEDLITTPSQALTRERAYRALIEYIEKQTG